MKSFTLMNEHQIAGLNLIDTCYCIRLAMALTGIVAMLLPLALRVDSMIII